jgi:hypothetical protein
MEPAAPHDLALGQSVLCVIDQRRQHLPSAVCHLSGRPPALSHASPEHCRPRPEWDGGWSRPAKSFCRIIPSENLTHDVVFKILDTAFIAAIMVGDEVGSHATDWHDAATENLAPFQFSLAHGASPAIPIWGVDRLGLCGIIEIADAANQ